MISLPGGNLRQLELVGRWDPGAPDRPPPPTAKEREQFYEDLEPLPRPESVSLVSRGIEVQGAPRTLAELCSREHSGAHLHAVGPWSFTHWDAQILAIPRLVGNFEMSGWVPETGFPGHQFGFALRNSDRGGDRVLVGIEGGATDKHEVWLATQREFQREVRGPGHIMRSMDHLFISLARYGDYVLTRYKYDLKENWIELGKPLYFPFDGAVDACLFARILDGRPPVRDGGVEGAFWGFQLKVPQAGD
jgi:hypothetical protein